MVDVYMSMLLEPDQNHTVFELRLVPVTRALRDPVGLSDFFFGTFAL